MIIDQQTIKEVIFSAIENANESGNYGLKKEDTAQIYGAGSNLDSLGLVSLLINVEEEISDKINKPLNLMSEKAMSRYKSPFNTVASLTEYIVNLMNNEDAN